MADRNGEAPSSSSNGARSVSRYAAAAAVTLAALVLALSLAGAAIGNRSPSGVGDFDRFHRPQDLAVDSAGNVFVADTGADRILEFDRSGALVRGWGGSGDGAGELDHPQGITADDAGHVYVADTGNDRIQEFDSSGAFIRKWGSFGSRDGEFIGPEDVATDTAGDVYVADTGNNRIQVFHDSGTFIRKWGQEGSGDDDFAVATSLAVGASGNVYVVDFGHSRVQEFDSSGAFIRKWGSFGYGDGEFTGPEAVATAPSGDVYVLDAANGVDHVQEFDSSGVFIRRWGHRGMADGAFIDPGGLWVDSSGSVYVADSGNDRIQVFDSSGVLTGIWPPNATIKRKRIDLENHKATFKFAGTGFEPLTFACRLDHAPFGRCSSPKTYRHLGQGKHAFRVEAIDVNGYVDPTPARAKFRMKQTPEPFGARPGIYRGKTSQHVGERRFHVSLRVKDDVVRRPSFKIKVRRCGVIGVGNAGHAAVHSDGTFSITAEDFKFAGRFTSRSRARGKIIWKRSPPATGLHCLRTVARYRVHRTGAA